MTNIWNDFHRFIPYGAIMDLIDGLRAFTATAETGSFTAAAERLGISNRLSSKYVAELEARLGVRLLARTTRRIGITAAGEALLARAPALLDELDEMLGEVREDGRGFSGTLRISAPVTFGEKYLTEMLARFAAPHPELTIDLRLDDAFTDLAAGGIDLAFRIGDEAGASLKRRRLGRIRAAIVAAPGYLAAHGTPERPEDLAAHACIVDTNRADPTRWTLVHDGAPVTVRVPTRFMVNSAQGARDLALAGRGVAYCPRFVLGDDLATGRLVALLPGYESLGHPISALWLGARTVPRKLRALIDFAAEDIRRAGMG